MALFTLVSIFEWSFSWSLDCQATKKAINISRGHGSWPFSTSIASIQKLLKYRTVEVPCVLYCPWSPLPSLEYYMYCHTTALISPTYLFSILSRYYGFAYPKSKSFLIHLTIFSFLVITDSSKDPPYQSKAIVGDIAVLPCNTTAPRPQNPPILVIWYKNGGGDPVYR